MVDDDLLWLVVVERGQSNWLCSSGEYSVRWGLSGRQDTHRWRNPACRRRCHTTESEIKGGGCLVKIRSNRTSIKGQSSAWGLPAAQVSFWFHHSAMLREGSLSSSPTLITIRQARQHFLMQTQAQKQIKAQTHTVKTVFRSLSSVF